MVAKWVLPLVVWMAVHWVVQKVATRAVSWDEPLAIRTEYLSVAPKAGHLANLSAGRMVEPRVAMTAVTLVRMLEFRKVGLMVAPMVECLVVESELSLVGQMAHYSVAWMAHWMAASKAAWKERPMVVCSVALSARRSEYWRAAHSVAGLAETKDPLLVALMVVYWADWRDTRTAALLVALSADRKVAWRVAG